MTPATREIPAGKILLGEYGDFTDEERSRKTTLEQRDANRKTYLLVHATPGFEPAGSVARWTNGYFAVWFHRPDGSRHGQRFKTEAEAREQLERWTQPKYECPNCGSHDEPTHSVACAEEISYWNCACGFSTWDFSEYERRG